MKYLLSSLLSLCVCNSVLGQSTDTVDIHQWTLSECIDYALEHNISLQKHSLDTIDAAIMLSGARLEFLPSVSAAVDYESDFGRTVNPVNGNEFKVETTVEPSIDASVVVFNGLKQQYNLRRAKLEFKQILLNYQTARDDVAMAVAACYFEILNASEQLTIADNSRTILTEQVSRLMANQSAESSISTLLQIKAKLAEVTSLHLAAQTSLRLAYFNLSQLLEIGYQSSFSIAIPDDVPLPVTAPLDDIIASAMDLPVIKSAELTVAIAEQNVRLSQSNLYPKIIMTGGYGSSYSSAQRNPITSGRYPFARQMRDGAAAYVGVTLTVPIFNRFEARNAVRHSRVEHSRSELSLAERQKNVLNDVCRSYIEAQGAYELYNANQISVESYVEAFRDTEQRFVLGTASAEDYNIALAELNQAQSEFAKMKYSALFKALLLAYYTTGTVK